MKREAEQVLCRFHLTSLARHGGEPLYQWIVETTHREGLQGATVLKGFLGLRPQRRLGERTWTLGQELPVIVEVVDGPGPLARLLARVEPHLLEDCHPGAGSRRALSPVRNLLPGARTAQK